MVYCQRRLYLVHCIGGLLVGCLLATLVYFQENFPGIWIALTSLYFKVR